jgi:NAD(P)-dependent dehydrogenase (short-subunit alcohol dehydrogenase family)
MLAQREWSVALVGRRKNLLDDVIRAAGKTAERLAAFECDVADEAQVGAMAEAVKQQLGLPTVLVNNAGVNLPRRSLKELTTADFRRLIDVNLVGAFLCVHQFLPIMRESGGGTIVNVISDAGLAASAKGGSAYAASKFGLRGLNQAINAEERGNGIRACAIFPGDIDTPLLEKRPAPPSAEQRALMLQPEDVAKCAMLMIEMPDRAIVEELLVRPR